MKQFSDLPPAWRRSLPAFLLLVAAVLLLYRDTALAMVEIWNRSETFAHAFVVPPISLWLIWRQRAVLARLRPSPSSWFLLPLAAMALMWMLADLVAVNSAAQLALTAMLVLLVPAALGWPVARAIAFPLGFLFFAVPIGEFMTPQLMEWTADFTVAAVRASGIPVFREGQQFIIPSGSWSVVEACSGIRYLMASVMVGTLFAYLNYRSMARRWVFVGVAIVLPLLANWLRAYIIVMLGHFSGNKIATGADHLVYGWVFFGIVMLLMFMVGARWSEPDAPAPASERDEVASPLTRKLGAAASLLSWAAIVLLLLVPHLALQAMQADEGPAEFALSAPLSTSGAWQLEPGAAPSFKPAISHPSAEWQGRFKRLGADEAASDAAVSDAAMSDTVASDAALPDPSPVGLYVAYFRQQNYQRKLISSSHVLAASNDPEWAIVGQDRGSQDVNGAALPLQTAELRRAGAAGLADASASAKRLKVWKIYWVNGRPVSSDWQAKLWGAFYRLAGQGDDAAVLVFYAEKAQADALLAAFMRDNWQALDAWLHGTREAARAGKLGAPLHQVAPAAAGSRQP